MNIPRKLEFTENAQTTITKELMVKLNKKCKAMRVKRTDVLRALIKEWVNK